MDTISIGANNMKKSVPENPVKAINQASASIRLTAIEKTITGLKKHLAIVSIVGALVGGGGVFGVAQWVYTAPVQRDLDTAKLKAENQGLELTRHKETIDSLQRSITLLAESQHSSDAQMEIDKLKKRIEMTEESLRASLAATNIQIGQFQLAVRESQSQARAAEESAKQMMSAMRAMKSTMDAGKKVPKKSKPIDRARILD